MSLIRSLTLLILLSLITACADRISPRMQQLEELAITSPAEALDSITAIDPATLGEADRHFLDFLRVKTADKAYMTHSSDSLILSVVDYESRHRRNGRYPEALYYAGRVYYDLDDYPDALDFFQQALELLPEDTDSQELRLRTLSQTGRLLATLRLYDKAIPYIKEAIEIEKKLNNKDFLLYDTHLLGSIHLRAKEYSLAEYQFRQAMALSPDSISTDYAENLMSLASVKYEKGQIDSALLLIRGITDRVSSLTMDWALAQSAEIYLKAGITDTAYIYAQNILSNVDYDHKEIAFQVLLAPEMRHLISPDSLDLYINQYRSMLEEYYDDNRNQLAINQQAFYNYSLHERDKLKAEHSENILKWVLVAVLLIILALTVFILYQRVRYQAKVIQLHNAINNLRNQPQPDDTPTRPVSERRDTVEDLRLIFREKLLALQSESTAPVTIHPDILSSGPYLRMQELISSQRGISDTDSLWLELEETVVAASPSFKNNLKLLSGGKLTSNDLRTALLIRCGITPSQMAILLNRSKGAIVSRRDALSMRIFDKKLGTKTTDSIIRLL